MTKKSNGHKSHSAGPLRGAIYRRTSTERQGERVSPEVQLADCEALARERGILVVAVYTDIDRYRVRGRMVEPSGSRVDRPGFVQMLADAAADKFDVIIAWKSDRLYRGVKPAVLVDDLIGSAGVTVELARETFDRKTLLLMAAIGRMELENIKERTEMGHRERVRRGLIHGGPVPAGYVAIRASGSAAVPGRDAAIGYEMDPAWRGFFDELARGYLARLPLAEIARNLGADPRTGRPWLDSTISYFLRNPFYRGRLAYGWQSGSPEFTVPALHQPAWDVPTVAAIERELARRGGKHNGPRGRALLSGILRCGICGYPMAAQQCRTRNPDGSIRNWYRGYGCARPVAVRTGRWYGRPTHAPNYINEHKLLRLLRALLADLGPADVDEYLSGISASLGGPAPDDGERRARLEHEAGALRARLADLAVGLDGVRNQSPAATEAIVSAITTAGKQLDRIRADLAELESRSQAAPDLGQARAAMLRLIGEPEILDRPGDVLQALLRDAFPALYVAGGRLTSPVAAWEE